jgi:hypothetical protein
MGYRANFLRPGGRTGDFATSLQYNAMKSSRESLGSLTGLSTTAPPTNSLINLTARRLRPLGRGGCQRFLPGFFAPPSFRRVAPVFQVGRSRCLPDPPHGIQLRAWLARGFPDPPQKLQNRSRALGMCQVYTLPSREYRFSPLIHLGRAWQTQDLQCHAILIFSQRPCVSVCQQQALSH